jgi:phosphodiesterase/alkaline phosphatase D-like protein
LKSQDHCEGFRTLPRNPVECGNSEAGFQPFTLLDAVRQENPDFFVYLGDTIYADTDSAAGNVTQIPPSETLPVYRAKYQETVRTRSCRPSWRPPPRMRSGMTMRS